MGWGRHTLLLAVACLCLTNAVPCPGETVLTEPAGSFSSGPWNASGEAGSLINCTFLIRHEEAPGEIGPSITIRFTKFSLQQAEECDPSAPSALHVYDGATTLSPLIAVFKCSTWSLASLRGVLLIELAAEAGTIMQDFAFEWSPSEDVCGDGVCNPAAGEHDKNCVKDCANPLPSASSYYQDLRRCGNDPDYMTATYGDGSETRRIVFKRAHFGPQLPAVRTRYSVRLAELDREVCEPLAIDLSPSYCADTCTASCSSECSSPCLDVIDNSACYSLMPTAAESAPLALLSGRLYCPFFNKADAMATAGAELGIVMSAKSPTDLYYMAVSSLRASEARALTMPVVLFSQIDSVWLRDRLGDDVTLEIDTANDARCEGEVILSGTSGTFGSNPAGRQYCSGQQCAWHIFAQEDAGDFLVLTFERFELECAQGMNGEPQDYVRIHDGGTRAAPVLATYSCYLAPLVISSGREVLVEFFSDDIGRENTNYGGFRASWTASKNYCEAFSDCGTCTAGPCVWCATTSRCLAPTDTVAANSATTSVCPLANLTLASDECCAAGFGGAGCSKCSPGHFGTNCSSCECDGGGCNDGMKGDGTCDCINRSNCTCGLHSLRIEIVEEGPGCDGEWDHPLCNETVSTLLLDWDSTGASVLSVPVLVTAGVQALWARVTVIPPSDGPISVTLLYDLDGREYELDAAHAYTSRALPLKHGVNKATLRLNTPNRASPCEVPLSIERPSSNDTSYAEWSTTAYREQYGTLDTPLMGAVVADSLQPILAEACDAKYATCFRLFTASTDSILSFSILAGGAAVTSGCGRAAHACSNSTRLELNAKNGLVVQGSVWAPKGDLSVAIRFPPGETPVELIVTAETGIKASHLMLVRRTLSPINTLSLLSLVGGSLVGGLSAAASSLIIVIRDDSPGALSEERLIETGTGLTEQMMAWRLQINVTTRWETICAGMPAPYCLPDQAPAAIDNSSSPATLWFYEPETRLPLVVTAEDGGRRVYEVVVKCIPCGYDGPIDETNASPSFLSASLWLILLVFTAALLFITLLALFCIRLHCIRQEARRRAAQQRMDAVAFAGVPPAEILQALSPNLTALDKADANSDDTCAICLGELCEELESVAGEADATPKLTDAVEATCTSGATVPTSASLGSAAGAVVSDEDVSNQHRRPRARRLRVRPPARSTRSAPMPEEAEFAVDQGPLLVSLPCGHRFHGECIRSWIVRKGFVASCPLCKRVIAPEHAEASAAQRQSRGSFHLQPSADAAAAAPLASVSDEEANPNSTNGAVRPAPPRLQYSASQFIPMGLLETRSAAPATGDGDRSQIQMVDHPSISSDVSSPNRQPLTQVGLTSSVI